MRRVLKFWLAACAFAIAAWPAVAQDADVQPSFDCAAATTPIEVLICADATLADLDRALADSYHAALATRVGEAQLLLREEQRAWARSRSGTCGVDRDPAIEVGAIGCLIALYRARIAELQPGKGGGNAASPSGYGWLMGDWTVAAIRKPPADVVRAAAAKAQLGRTLHLAEGPITTLGGAACSFPRYSAEPAPRPEFGDLSDYPAAVMVRLSCVGIALLDFVRLTDEKILIGRVRPFSSWSAGASSAGRRRG
ncbi:lysozyme inhibitor LprI family protein [Dongia deserti]|uniref:lysozyme inhibitor LprI family protein n=1 Tax=Dongia deserti TaxID=2268030 RepID=UPI0013C51D25|nr:lysozyme inhibitor LprI family protein [Dongia deserti]